MGLFSKCFCMDLIETWFDDSHNWTMHFDTSVNDLDFHYSSQGEEKPSDWAVILL